MRSLLATGRHRVVYRPHPRTGLSVAAYRRPTGDRRAHRAANRADAGAGHVVDIQGPFGWQVDAPTSCVIDVSAVAYDWLATGKPLVITRPAEPRAVLPGSGWSAS